MKFIRLFVVITLMTFINCRNKTNVPAEKQEQKIESVSYGMSDFKNVQKIDGHIHISSKSKTMINLARANNFKLLNVIVNASQNPPVEEQIKVRKMHFKEDPDITAYSTAFSLDGWDEPDWSEKVIRQLKKDFDEGANSIKTWKNIGMEARDKHGNLITLDDPKFDPVFKFVKDEGKVLLSHAGEPLNCWLPLDSMTVNNDRSYFKENPKYHMYLHPEFPSYQDQIDQRDNMLEKNPDLTVIAFHMASLEWSVDEAAKFLERFPNTTLDLAARISNTQYQSQRDLEKVRNFFIKYQDRIVYGTDFIEHDKTVSEELESEMMEAWVNDWKYFNTNEQFMVPQLDTPVQGLALPKKVVDKIYYHNARKIFPDAWK